MGSISDYLEDSWIDHVLGTTPYTPETNLYIGLSIADPLDDASGISEPVGNGYARKIHASWNTAATRAIDNNGVITFDSASGAWGTISHYFICNHLSNASFGSDVELLAHGSLSTSKSVVDGNTPSIADTEISISLNAGAFSDLLVLEMLDHTMGNGVYTAPTISVGLSTSTPADAGTGITEPSGNNYGRVTVATWNASSGGASANTGDIDFPTPSGSWGLITYTIVGNHATNTSWGSDVDLLMYGTVTNQTPDDGDTVKFPAEDFDITLT
jgi:hypothetical protein